VALAIATCVFLVVGARYRLLLVPGLAPFAGLGFAALVHARVSGAAVAVAAAAGSLAWRHVPSANLSEERALTGQSLVKEGRDAEAEEALQRAVASHLCSALAHDGLGMLRAARGDRAGARASFDAALQCNDEYAKAHAHAGQLAVESGDLARAADAQQPAAADEALRRALALIGNTPELQFTTALVRHKQHRYAEADRILRALLAQDPDMANARALDAVNRRFVE
jgi:tetratricopeptide (TPR) repeat protein